MGNNSQITHPNNTHRLIRWGVCLILLLPIAVLPPNFQASDWTRAILFRIILTLLVSFLLYKFFYKKEISIPLPKWKVSTYVPFLILSVFIFLVIVSTIFSQDIWFSIFGSPERAGGVLNYLFYFLFTILLVLFIKEEDWGKLWNVLFITGFIASLLGIIQYFGILKNIFIPFGEGAVPSFLGNSTFLGIYMLFLTFLSFTLLTQEQSKKRKILYAALVCLFMFTIFTTGSRATYLGILIGFLCFFFFYPRKLTSLKITAALLLLIAVGVVLLFNFFPQLGETNHTLNIVANRLSIKTIVTDLVGTRFSAWKITLEAIQDKPWLGWGPENFYIGFEKHYDPTLPNLQGLWWDRPHNIFLDIAVNSGILSSLFYIAFWVALLWQLQQFKRKQGDAKDTYLAHGLQVMFIGYLVVLFFNFDSFSSYLTSFFFVGYAFYLLSRHEEKVVLWHQQKFITYKNKKVFAGIFSIILILFVFFWNIKPLYANEKISYAKNLANIKECNTALSIMNGLDKSSDIIQDYAALIYNDIIKKCASQDKEIEYARKGLEALKRASTSQPSYTRTWLFMGAFTDVLAAREKDPDTKNKLVLEARDYLKKAQSLSPGRQGVIIEMEKNYIVATDYQGMKKLAGDCITIDPSYGECYWYLGISEIFLGDQEEGKKNIELSKEKNYNNPPYIQLAGAYLSQKNYQDAANAYKTLIALYPDNASYHATLAIIYKSIGEFERARLEAIEVFKLQPENPETIQFILGLSSTANPRDIDLHYALVDIYKTLGNKEKYREELLKIKSIYLQLILENPNSFSHHFNLAHVYQELGDYENSFKEAIIALKLSPGSKEEVVNFIINNLPEGEKWLEKQR